VQVTRHDIKDRKAIGKMSEAYPHLILDNFTTKVHYSCTFQIVLLENILVLLMLNGAQFCSFFKIYLVFFNTKIQSEFHSEA
jgi:hypothetical protein